jgi:hypothetical protein
MSNFPIVNEGVELPCTERSVIFAVCGNVAGGLVIGLQPGSKFLIIEDLFEFGVGVLERGRVPFLTRRLIFLVVLYTFAVKGFAGFLGLIEITDAAAIRLAMNLINAGRGYNL